MVWFDHAVFPLILPLTPLSITSSVCLIVPPALLADSLDIPLLFIMLIGPSACSFLFPTVSSDHARWLRHRSAEISYCVALPDFLSCNAATLLFFFKSPLIASHLKSISLQTQLQGTTLHVFSVYVHAYPNYLHGYKSVHTLLVRVLFGYVFWE